MQKLAAAYETPCVLQAISARAWADECRVAIARRQYQEKIALAASLLGDRRDFSVPNAGLFVWLDAGNGEQAAITLWRDVGIRVLPGAYLAQAVSGENPGERFNRIALVAAYDRLAAALERVRGVI